MEEDPLPNNREEAFSRGSKHFFTGKPCKNGHIDKRFTIGGSCLSCNREYQAKFSSTPSGRAYHRDKSICHLMPGPRTKSPEINEFYANCPPGHHVDHIIPRNNKFVVGTHSLSNLQYLPAEENMRKKNRIDPPTLEAVVCVLPQYRVYKSSL